MKIEYDPKCEELARWCLVEEHGDPYDPVLASELASVIQKAIESWAEEREPGFETRQEPEDYSGQGDES